MRQATKKGMQRRIATGLTQVTMLDIMTAGGLVTSWGMTMEQSTVYSWLVRILNTRGILGGKPSESGENCGESRESTIKDTRVPHLLDKPGKNDTKLIQMGTAYNKALDVKRHTDCTC